jgi:hypothetical protein
VASQIDAAQLAAQLGLTPGAVDSALAVLGARGLVGYDLITALLSPRTSV